MNIQELVPDLSICREAKEKGVVIESAFKYFKFSLNKDYLLQFDPTNDFMTLSGELEDKVSAPLTDEILEIFKTKNKLDSFEVIKKKDGYNAYFWNDKDCNWTEVFDKKLSNALLLLAIKLKEEDL